MVKSSMRRKKVRRRIMADRANTTYQLKRDRIQALKLEFGSTLV